LTWIGQQWWGGVVPLHHLPHQPLVRTNHNSEAVITVLGNRVEMPYNSMSMPFCQEFAGMTDNQMKYTEIGPLFFALFGLLVAPEN